MTVWRWIVFEAVVLSAMVGLIAAATQLDSDVLRATGIMVGAGGTAAIVMAAKRQRQRRTRSAEPDSVETANDFTARAAAYLDALLLTATAVLIATVWPELPLVVVLVGLLATFALAYWTRRLLSSRG